MPPSSNPPHHSTPALHISERLPPCPPASIPLGRRVVMASAPPRYARVPTRPHNSPPGAGPGTASRRPATEHSYHLSSSKGRPWLTLKVISNAPASNYLPSFFEGEAIRGNVVLDRDKEDSIKSISVQVGPLSFGRARGKVLGCAMRCVAPPSGVLARGPPKSCLLTPT